MMIWVNNYFCGGGRRNTKSENLQFLLFSSILLLQILQQIGGNIPHRIINWAASSLIPKMIEESHEKCSTYPEQFSTKMRSTHLPKQTKRNHIVKTKKKKTKTTNK